MNPRIAAPWGLAALACAAILMGFRSNETALEPPVTARTEATVHVASVAAAGAGRDAAASHAAAVLVSDSDCRARAAVPQAPHGVGRGTPLRRAQFSRGEPGLLIPMDAVPAACARVTPGALPSMQPPVSSAH